MNIVKDRDKLVLEHMNRVQWIARDMMRKLPVCVDPDDLIQAGMVGLIAAAERYEEDRGLKFWTFASHRVRGQMLDYLRDLDGASRDQRNVQKKADAIWWDHINRFQEEPSDIEMAEALGMSVKRWRGWKVRIIYDKEISLTTDFNDPGHDLVQKDFVDPIPLQDRGLNDSEMQKHLMEAIKELPERHQQFIRDYFWDGKTLKNASLSLGVAEARGSQIKTAALAKLREILSARGVTLENLDG